MIALHFQAIGAGWNAYQSDWEYVGQILPCHPQTMPLYQVRIRDGNGRDELVLPFHRTPDDAKHALVAEYARRFST